MFALLASTLLSIGFFDQPTLGVDQLRGLIRAERDSLRSLVFVYEGKTRWVGEPRLTPNVRLENWDFQGTFLYRSDGAAFYDIYTSNFGSGDVVRRKAALFKNKIEATHDLLDAKERTGQGVESSMGTLVSLNPYDSPLDLRMIWSLEAGLNEFAHDVEIVGWESFDGRHCLRVRLHQLITADDHDKERDKRFYWLDLERDAQVLKVEFFRYGQLVARIDEIRLSKHLSEDGTSHWLPVHSRRQVFAAGNEVTKEPLFERTLAITAGTELINVNLPDALFSVTRTAAYPTPEELKGFIRKAQENPLALKFQRQVSPPPPRPRYDPVSVRQQVEKRLAEADRQSKELEASSPARQAWTMTTLIQIGGGGLGLVLLGVIAARRWRAA